MTVVTLEGANATYTGESTDTKPVDAFPNTLFKELDTGDTYYYNGTAWAKVGGTVGTKEAKADTKGGDAETTEK